MSLGDVNTTKWPEVGVIDALYVKWVLTPQKEIEYLKSELKIACRYLSEAKKKWASGTTNSDVDGFLEKWGKDGTR